MTPWEPGAALGPYTLISLIGAGGMGEVWKARDTRLNRIVAIKRLKGRHTSRFEQEARAIAALNHPNICQIYDVGPDYLVMEYIDGKPLSGPLADDEAVRLALQVAGALEEAHGKKILHRDLKPGNILVTAKGVAKVLDFGLAKFMADSDATNTMDGTVLGTAAYMSPEQAQGMAVDERSDIFSFGAVLYEVLSGRRAFAGGSMAQVLIAVVRDEPAPLHSGRAADVVKRCLAKESAQRFQSAVEVTAALERIGTKPVEQQPSIAVLPFADMSPGKDNEYFSDGLAEEILNALAQIQGLKVIARTSSFAFRGKEQDITKIAETLRVRTILEGSVRKAGNRIRVTAQLIDAGDGSHLWSQRYDREMEDVFAVQDDIAGAIAGALQVKLGATPQRYQPNLAAYEAYLKGRYFGSKFTPDGMARFKDYFEQAIRLDPEFALAHSELGLYLFFKATLGLETAREAMPMVRAAVQRALEIDPSLPEAHALLGDVAALYDYDWKEAERQFRLAMAHAPVSASVRMQYGSWYLLFSGRAGEAVEEFRLALKEDPLSLIVRHWLAAGLLAAGRDEEAFAELDRLMELGEHFGIHNDFVIGHAAKGRFTEALAHAERSYALAHWDPVSIGLLAGLLVRTGGDASRVRGLLDKLADPQVYKAAVGIAIFHLVCGEIDQAADWFEKSIEERNPSTLFFIISPLGKPLRSSDRWLRLAKMMNLPEAV